MLARSSQDGNWGDQKNSCIGAIILALTNISPTMSRMAGICGKITAIDIRHVQTSRWIEMKNKTRSELEQKASFIFQDLEANFKTCESLYILSEVQKILSLAMRSELVAQEEAN